MLKKNDLLNPAKKYLDVTFYLTLFQLFIDSIIFTSI